MILQNKQILNSSNYLIQASHNDHYFTIRIKLHLLAPREGEVGYPNFNYDRIGGIMKFKTLRRTLGREGVQS